MESLAIGLGGFAAGSTITEHLMVLMGVSTVHMGIFVGGIIGEILLYALFDWALIGLSSVAGATLIIQALNWNCRVEMVLLLTGFFSDGIVAQAAS